MRNIILKGEIKTLLAFERQRIQDAEFSLACVRGMEFVAEWQSFALTMFTMFYQKNLNHIDGEIRPYDNWVNVIIERHQNFNLAKMRESTVNNELLSRVATTHLLKEFELNERKRLKSKVDIAELDDSIESMESILEKNADDAYYKSILETLKEQRDIENNLRQELRASDIDNQTLKANETKIEKISNVIRIFGGFGIGQEELCVEEFDQKTLMMFANNQDMIAMLQKIGAVISVSNSKMKITETGHCNVVGVEMSGDVQHFVPSELALLGTEREDELLKRTIERSVTSWKMDGEDNLGKGDMLVLLDVSSSMTGASITFARALAGACVVIAKRQKRNLQLCVFNDANETKKLLNGKGFSECMNLIFKKPCGGTNIGAALDRSRDQLISKKVDCLIITDGEFDTQIGVEHTRFLRAKKSSITLAGINIDVSKHRSWTDEIVNIDALNDDPADLVFKFTSRGIQ